MRAQGEAEDRVVGGRLEDLGGPGSSGGAGGPGWVVVAVVAVVGVVPGPPPLPGGGGVVGGSTTTGGLRGTGAVTTTLADFGMDPPRLVAVSVTL